MPVYLPRYFAEQDLAKLDGLIAAHPFVTLISTDAENAPFVSHLPVLYRRDGERIVIEGHWARPNPQARHQGDMLMIVHGPDAYVSPGWYLDKESAARVPTWNYAVAHLRGPIEIYEDETRLGDLVSRMSRRFEPTVRGDWEFEPEREDHRKQLRGIIGFRFEPSNIELKFKLSQNHPAANREAVIAAMTTGEDRDAHAVAALMRSVDAASSSAG